MVVLCEICKGPSDEEDDCYHCGECGHVMEFYDQKGGAQVDKRKYTITYKDGQQETVTGSVMLFSNGTGGSIPKFKNLIYINSDTVRSVIEVETEGEMTDGAHE